MKLELPKNISDLQYKFAKLFFQIHINWVNCRETLQYTANLLSYKPRIDLKFKKSKSAWIYLYRNNKLYINSIDVGCLYKHPNIDISELSESLTTFSNVAISTHGCSNYPNLEMEAECRVRITIQSSIVKNCMKKIYLF